MRALQLTSPFRSDIVDLLYDNKRAHSLAGLLDAELHNALSQLDATAADSPESKRRYLAHIQIVASCVRL